MAFPKENEPAIERESKPEPAKTAINDFGLEVQPLTPELAKSFGLSGELQGLARQRGQGGKSRRGRRDHGRQRDHQSGP